MKALVNYALIHTNKLFLHLTIYRKQNSQMLIMLIGCPPFPHTITMCCTAFNIAKIDTTEILLKVALYGCLFKYKSTVSMKILIWSLIVRKFIHFILLLVIRKEVVLNPLHKLNKWTQLHVSIIIPSPTKLRRDIVTLPSVASLLTL